MEQDNKTEKNNQQTSLLKRFGISLAGGILGGGLVLGGAQLLSNDSNSTSTNSTKSQTTQVSNISYDVTSDTTKAVDKVQNAVVSVINLQKQQAMSDPFGGLFGGNSPSNQKEEDNDNLETSSEGSGVIYRKDGDFAYIVTNNHVVSGSDALEILLNDGTTIKGELVGRDSYTDLAVIKISSKDIKTTATFGDSDKIKVGEPAIAIGSPLGTEYASSVTQGIISAKNRSIQNTNDDNEPVNINAIQTDAAINPGNSGGALINAAGQVIGINSVKIASSTSGVSAEGMGFAIPSNDVVNIINQLEKDGKVTRPALGVSMYDLANISSQQRSEILNLTDDVTAGIVIMTVQNATPAEKAGLEKYDVIVDIDGEAIESSSDLQSILYNKKVGDTIKVTYYRGKEKKTTSVKLSIDQSALQQNNTNN
ncbi:S1C family serine protease [Vagococcus xieshaowenii]|uniref:PDZ domain-containing protein n=1 Tax=Vagococcus xieshaowenii TaxID=2562451 RepID=A0AAJ5JLW5_9ENTE|nr:trypsin-like peptidase domain-containing protein [Vagococcus xieshaowenii]QCA27919.1 PDZ domain-containing protein [Vagococcus xieshaowenii]TFZ39403.1 PDZ domain-containing protein [Vagococcus xieshaowenii]